MSTTSLVAKGQFCIEAARKAYGLINTREEAEDAAKELSFLQENGRYLIEAAEESKKQLLIKEEELHEENLKLESQKLDYDVMISKLNRDKRNAEQRLSSLNI